MVSLCACMCVAFTCRGGHKQGGAPFIAGDRGDASDDQRSPGPLDIILLPVDALGRQVGEEIDGQRGTDLGDPWPLPLSSTIGLHGTGQRTEAHPKWDISRGHRVGDGDLLFRSICLGLAVLPSPLLVSRPAAVPEGVKLLAQKGAIVGRGRCHAPVESAKSWLCVGQHCSGRMCQGLSKSQRRADKGEMPFPDLRQPQSRCRNPASAAPTGLRFGPTTLASERHI